MSQTASTRGCVVITGGSRGIGAATALRCAEAGYDVCFSYVAERAAAQQIVAAVEARGRKALAVKSDVSEERQVLELFEATGNTFGAPVGLVNNAGIIGARCTVAEVSAAVLAQVMMTNVVGAMLCGREAARRMSTQSGGHGGAIVNVSSAAATLGSAGEYVHYAASKAALDTFTIGFAQEVARQGIRVNAVSPGFVETEIHARAGAPDRLAKLAPTLPIGRAATAEEVANAIVWMLGEEASYVTGANLRVAGGR